MAKLKVERKRKTAWPLLLGVLVLALVLWAITGLLTEDDDAGPDVTVPTVEDTYPPAAIPAPPDLEPANTGADAARQVDEVAPLGEEDIGQLIRVAGEVVATGNDAFWILAGDEVVRVESPRVVRKGDTLSIAGTLRQADPSRTNRISDVLDRHPAADAWSVVTSVKLVEDDAPAATGQSRSPRPEA